MDTLTLLHQGVLYLHVLAFAVAFSTVAREDLALLRERRIDLQRLSRTASTLSIALAVLWLSGIALLLFDVGLDLQRLLASPKPMAKVLVVSALTANGFGLHTLAFPMLRDAQEGREATAVLPVVLGATSSASWLYASFMGVSRVIAPAMSLVDFMALYLALLAMSIAAAMVFVRPRVARWLAANAHLR